MSSAQRIIDVLNDKERKECKNCDSLAVVINGEVQFLGPYEYLPDGGEIVHDRKGKLVIIPRITL